MSFIFLQTIQSYSVHAKTNLIKIAGYHSSSKYAGKNAGLIITTVTLQTWKKFK